VDLTEAPASRRAGYEPARADDVRPDGGVPWIALGLGLTLVLGVVVRFATLSALWLDEAQTVAIAKLPLSKLPEGLRHDGAPPLFYVLLHGWMRVFGDGNLSVRFLPGLFAAAALPLAWLAGRRLGGRQVAWAAVVLLASSPFAARYATETRMYSLVVLLVLVGYLAVAELLARPGSGRAAVGVGLVTAALLYTHYWSLYLLAVIGAVFVALAVRAPDPSPARQGARRGLVAMAVGGLTFVPWLPSFLFQLQHTGTPWGGAGRLRSMVDTVFDFSGGYWDPGLLLGMLTYVLIALALAGRAVDGRRIELDLRTRPGARHLAVAGFGTLAVAIVATVVGGSAFAARYASVMFPMVILLAAVGAGVLVDRRVRYGVLAAAVVFGFWATAPNVFGNRTSAPRVADALIAGVRPGDVVAYCPDQLGPSVSRLLPAGIDQLTFPRGTAPQVVDWVDYASVNKKADPAAFAQMLLSRAGPTGTVWVVWAPGYRTFKDKCQGILGNLDLARRNNTRPVKLPKNFEHPGLIRFPPS
jgi:hypothetical protein